jgi:tryptophan-rich sensory protein
MTNKLIKIFLSLLLCDGAGFIGSLATRTSVKTWYTTINKPFFNPPNWIFAPVWIALYTLMGVSFYLVLDKGLNNKDIRYASTVFCIHLLVNALWSFAFFGAQSPLAGLFVILPLLFLIAYTMKLFYPISNTASYLLIPYLLWVSFASVLNISFVVLNK